VRFLPLFLLAGVSPETGIFSAWGISTVVALCIGSFFLLPRLHLVDRLVPTFNLPVIGRMMKYSLSNFSVNLLWMSPGLLLPLLVTNILGVQANAFFAIGWAMASIILMIPMGISMALFAEGCHEKDQLTDHVNRGALLMLLLIIPVIFIIWLAGEKLLLIFGTAYSQNAIQLLRLLAISAAPAGINYLYLSVSRVQKRMMGTIWLSGFIATTTLVMSYVLLPERGIEGVGLAYLIAQTMPFPVVSFLLIRSAAVSDKVRREPEYGVFLDGAKVSVADHALHLGRYRFAGVFAVGERCLDIGCGTGYGSDYLARQGAQTVVAGDISGDAVALACRENSANIILDLQKFDATALPFAGSSFELVTAFEVIEHIRDCEKLVAEAHRVLAPGGTLVLSTPNRDAGPVLFATSWDNHVHEFTVEELTDLVKSQFGTCEVYGQDFIGGKALLMRRLRQTAGRTLEKLQLRPFAIQLGRLLFKHNRLVVFRRDAFKHPDATGGKVSTFASGLTPTTIVIVARKS
jgi:2-polyprenyl-3-methyl-5-hydroxy-6-metoxy-1,4-benzoquinol methylase